MIVNGLLDVIFGIVSVLLTPFNHVFNIPVGALNGFYDVLSFVGYLLPLAQLMPIILMFVALQNYRIIVSIIRTIWDLLPIA